MSVNTTSYGIHYYKVRMNTASCCQWLILEWCNMWYLKYDYNSCHLLFTMVNKATGALTILYLSTIEAYMSYTSWTHSNKLILSYYYPCDSCDMGNQHLHWFCIALDTVLNCCTRRRNVSSNLWWQYLPVGNVSWMLSLHLYVKYFIILWTR